MTFTEEGRKMTDGWAVLPRPLRFRIGCGWFTGLDENAACAHLEDATNTNDRRPNILRGPRTTTTTTTRRNVGQIERCKNEMAIKTIFSSLPASSLCARFFDTVSLSSRLNLFPSLSPLAMRDPPSPLSSPMSREGQTDKQEGIGDSRIM